MKVHKIDYGQRVYQGTLDAVRQVIIATMLVIDSYNGETIGEPWISDRDEYVAGATPSTGAQVAYTLDEPLEIPVAVSNLPIKSLSGYNHIESSTGEMEIEYFPAKEQPLIDLIPEASNMHEYSTAEHAVGTWVDGSTIYERSIDLGSFSIGSEGTYIIEQATDIDLLIDYDGYVIENSIMYALPDPSIRIKMDSNKDLIFSGTASWYVSSGYLTIRYTKTASNNRSLAKSAPQEETKEEQVEELKEEPTEEIKEEPTEEVKEEETKEEGEVNER